MAENKVVVNRVSFSLEPEYHALLRDIAKMRRRSMTDELRLMLDERAAQLGMKPIDPNPSASTLELAR